MKVIFKTGTERNSHAFQFIQLYDFLSDSCIALFCFSPQGQISLAVGGELLFLYELESQVRSAHDPIDLYHLLQRPSHRAGEVALAEESVGICLNGVQSVHSVFFQIF